MPAARLCQSQVGGALQRLAVTDRVINVERSSFPGAAGDKLKDDARAIKENARRPTLRVCGCRRGDGGALRRSTFSANLGAWPRGLLHRCVESFPGRDTRPTADSQ